MTPLARCEARGFQLEQLPGVSAVELQVEADRLKACSIEELRNACAQRHFPAAGITTPRGEHDELVRVLLDVYVWQRMDVASLRKLATARGLVVTDFEQSPMLLKKLREAAWREQGIPLQGDNPRAQELLDHFRRLEHKSLEILRGECIENKLPFVPSMRKEELVSMLRVQAIWRELVPIDRLQKEHKALKDQIQGHRLGIIISADFLLEEAMKEQVTRREIWDFVEGCRNDVVEAYLLACQLRRLPLADLRRHEEQLYHRVKEELTPSPLLCQWLALEESMKASSLDRVPFKWEALHHRGKQALRQTRYRLCQPLWEASGIPVHILHPEQAAGVAGRWISLQRAPLPRLLEEYCRYGLPKERRLDKRAYRKRLRWLALEDGFGRTSWKARGLAANIPIHRLPFKSWADRRLPILRLARRLDKLASMDEDMVLEECQERGLLWTATAEHSELRERLCREAELLELDWDELYVECEAAGVPLDGGLHFWGLAWFSEEQETELKTWLAHWCLVYESRHFRYDRSLPRLRLEDAVSLLAWCVELEGMSHTELKGLYVGQGLPEDTGLQRQDMLESLRKRLVWEVLPLDELRRMCPADMESADRQELVSWLSVEEIDRAYRRRGISAKDLRSPLAAAQLNYLLCTVGNMDQQALVERCCELGLPVVGLPPREQLVKRLNKVYRWSLLSEEALVSEWVAIDNGSVPGVHGGRPDDLEDALKLHECSDDFQRKGIPTDRLMTFAACAQLAKDWEEIGALTLTELKCRVTQKLGSAFAESPISNMAELLKEAALLEKVPFQELKRLCQACTEKHGGARAYLENLAAVHPRTIVEEGKQEDLSTIVKEGKQEDLLSRIVEEGNQEDLVRQLAWALRSNVYLDVLKGQPSKLELLSLLEACKAGFTEAMSALSWWDLHVFLRKLDTLHQKPAATTRGAQPRVSVVVPTCEGRQHFHKQLWHCFVEQTWEDKELIVVETWTTRPSPFFASKKLDPRLVYFDFKVDDEKPPAFGSKRNLGAQLASGTYIANFDDGDFYAPLYLKTMLQNMGEKDAIKLSKWYAFDAGTGRFGYVDATIKEDLLYGYGFSFVYTRDIATRVAYPWRNHVEGECAEDYAFLERICETSKYGVALLPDNFGICLHCTHGSNCSNNEAQYEVSDSEVRVLEVTLLPGFDSFLDQISRVSRAVMSGAPLLPRVREQKIEMRSPKGVWTITVPAGSTHDEVVERLKEATDDVVGWGRLRLSLREATPSVLMSESERVPLRADMLFVNFQVNHRSACAVRPA